MPPKITDDERRLFRSCTEDVKPFVPKKAQVATIKQQISQSARHIARRHAGGHLPRPVAHTSKHSTLVATVFGEDKLLFRRPDLPAHDYQELCDGRLHIVAELDVHGMTAAELTRKLYDFIHAHQHKRRRCVRIVHGKGRHSEDQIPVLKNELNKQLREYDAVLAFVSAQAKDGGTGAIYVLLQ